jgi:cytidylate kinase
LVIVRVIAIDGPAGAGKSTVARQVSTATGLRYLDTGAMYRCVALAVQQSSTDPHDPESVGRIAHDVSVVIERDAAKLNGVDVSQEIRSSEINGIVSIIAAHTPVRDAMREQQRRWIRDHQGGVVEGRDIGTVVFPDAILKVFLTASPEVRAERRVGQTGGDIQAVAASIAERDHLDSTRIDSPLKPSPESVVVDSSNRTIDDVVAEIVAHFEKVDHG